MVKKALSIYALHYVLTRHLCLTHASVAELQGTKLVPQNMPWVTPRLLNRQIKALLDEQLLKETTSLFETFAKSLKPKSRKEWAPCLVSFLVLCLFMEAVETAADTFVVSQTEVDLRSRSVPAYRRSFALAICKEIENLPFKQFAYQFHNIYQTHTRDASTKAFNPLLDDNLAAQGELDSASRELVSSLHGLLQGDSCKSARILEAGKSCVLTKCRLRAGFLGGGSHPAESGEPPVSTGHIAQLYGSPRGALHAVLPGREISVRWTILGVGPS